MLRPSLPNTMSELLESAIRDARSLSRHVYKPHYGEWHCVNVQGKCEVCLGGSIIAGSLAYAPRQEVRTDMLTLDSQRKVEALNSMRTGNWVYAYELIHRTPPSEALTDQLHRVPAPAKTDFVGWREFDLHLKSLEKIVPQLRAIEQNAREKGAIQ